MELKGKTALVCGSTQGIGWATAKLMTERGASIILMARNEEKLKTRVEELNTIRKGNHKYVKANFADLQEFKTCLSSKIKGERIDILVNNTGGPAGGAIFSAKVEEFVAAFQQHLICNHLLVQTVVPSMKENGGGRIINVISTSVKQPLPNLGVSNTIRGAVANWSKTLANELGVFNITVNNVLPGATNTTRLKNIASVKAEGGDLTVEQVIKDMGKESPMKRVAEPEEVAEAIAFLASPKASYINGINVPVDGGRTKSL
jgi:3-oxoacyl-[acyl-carrier protein] reductase